MSHQMPNIRVKEINQGWFGSSNGLMRLLDSYDKLHKGEVKFDDMKSHRGSVAVLRSMVKMIQLSSDVTEKWRRWVHDNLGPKVHPASPHAFVEVFKRMDIKSLYESRMFPVITEAPLVQLKSILRAEQIIKTDSEHAN